mmetsp:Transcript_25504/g.70374  ORF Transcript_25504/g.70374 Transcript_25504/m.70374 type:complete len:111 (+) Transcript_25504:142-474(+)|eukprot:scaffold126537_cov30-Tisochrysis_lutea.AAC.6
MSVAEKKGRMYTGANVIHRSIMEKEADMLSLSEDVRARHMKSSAREASMEPLIQQLYVKCGEEASPSPPHTYAPIPGCHNRNTVCISNARLVKIIVKAVGRASPPVASRL